MIGLPGFCEVCKGSIDQLALFVDQLNRIQNNIEQLATKINQDVAIQRTIHQNKKVRTAKSFPGVSQNISEAFHSITPLMTRTETFQSAATDKFSTSGSEKINNTHYEKSTTSNNFDDQLDWSHSPAESDKSLETGEAGEVDDTTIKSYEILTHMKKADSGYKCENCSRTFSRLTILKSHDCTKDTYDCDTCGFSFSGPSVLKLHISRTHSGEKPFKCDTCGTTFGFKHHLTRHIRIHTGEKPFECSECEKKFGCQTELSNHKKKHKNIRFPCEVCDKTYVDMRTLRMHLKTHVDLNLKCDICQKTFGRVTVLKKHKETVHSKDKPEKLYFCEYCGKSFRTTRGLQHHMLRHTSEQSVECDVCSKVFSCEQYLKVHKSQYHSKLETIICDVCGKNCTSQVQYRHHILIHRDYELECQICGKKYKNNQKLAYHVRVTHTEEKPFKCDLCEESYKRHRGLKRHKLRAHLAVIDKNKFFTCQVCSEPFDSNLRLLNHQLQLHHVTSEEFVECQNCNQKLPDLGMYEWHICKKPLITHHLRCNTCENEKDDENDILTFANYCDFFAHLKYCHDDLEPPERYKCKHCGLIMPVLVKIKTHACDRRDNPVTENKLNLESRRKSKKKKGTGKAKSLKEIRRSPRKMKTLQKSTIKKDCESAGESDEDVDNYLKEEVDDDFNIKSEMESLCDSDEMAGVDIEVKMEVDYY